MSYRNYKGQEMRLDSCRKNKGQNYSSFEKVKGQAIREKKWDYFFLLRVKGKTIISGKYKGLERDNTSQIWVTFKRHD